MAEVTVRMCDIKGCDSIAAERLGIVMFKGPGQAQSIRILQSKDGFDMCRPHYYKYQTGLPELDLKADNE